MKRRSLLGLVASSTLLGGSARAQVSPNQPTSEPSTTTPSLITLYGTGWSGSWGTDRVEKVQPAEGARALVFFHEPEDAVILELAEHKRDNDVFMTGPSGIQSGEDYLDTRNHVRTWNALRSKFRDPIVAVDDSGAQLEFLSYEHSWTVFYFEDKQTAEYFEMWSLPNEYVVLLHLGENFLETFNPSLGNLMYLRSGLAFENVTFPDSPDPFPNLNSHLSGDNI